MLSIQTQRGSRIVLLITVAIGFAFFLSMNSFSLWGLPALSDDAFGDNTSVWWSQPLALSNIVAFFALYAAVKCWGARLARVPFPAAVLLLASGIVSLLGFFLTGSLAALCIAGVLVGAGTTCCFFCWEQLFFDSGITLGKAEIVLGTTLSIPAFALLFVFGPQNMLFSVALLALGNLTLIWVARWMVQRLALASTDPNAPSPDGVRRLRPALLRAACCIVMVGVISPVLDIASSHHPSTVASDYLLLLSANVLSAVIMAFVWFVLRKKTSVTSAYVVLFPILITSFFALPFLEPSYSWVVFFLGKFSFTLFSIVTMDWCATAAREEGVNLFILYGLLGGLLYTSRFIGTFVGFLVGTIALPQEAQLFACVAVLLYGCAVVMFVVMRKESKGPHDSKPSTEDGSVEHPGASQDVLHEACLALAQEHSLSARQTEVLDLLAHGYDVPTAAKKLFISENTVRTHLKKIYSSLDVHSRQEVIDLVNARFKDASEAR